MINPVITELAIGFIMGIFSAIIVGAVTVLYMQKENSETDTENINWIPAEECKPAIGERVLIQNDLNEVTEGYYNGRIWWTHYKYNENVLYWQPEPEPYRPKE